MGSKADVTSGLLGTIGSAIGYGAGQGDRDKAKQDYQDAIDTFRGVNPNVTAERAAAERQGPSAYGGIHSDPNTREAQMGALSQLQQIYKAGGMDPQARAEIAQHQASANQNAQALNGQIQGNMARRGLSSSGASFAAQQQAGQNAANNSNLAGLASLAAGQNRAMGALSASGQLAGGVRGQDWGQAAQRADAQDAIGRFNAMNQTQNNQYNSGQNLRAQEATAQNALGRAHGIAGGLDAQGRNYTGQAQKTQEMWTGGGQAAGAVIGGGADQADQAVDTVGKYASSSGGSGGSGGGGGLMAMFGGG